MVPRSKRGQATQLDFLTAAVIVITAIALYNIGAGVILNAQGETVSASDQVTIRAEERVVDDLLVNETGDTLLAPGCSRAFFTAGGNASCGIPAGTGPSYLRSLVGVGDYDINITVRNESGIINLDPSNGSRPFRHAVGEPYPQTGEVVAIDRLVSYGTDLSRDDSIDKYTLTVRVWESP